MKKQLKDLNISIPVIDVLESRKLFGGNGGYGDPPFSPESYGWWQDSEGNWHIDPPTNGGMLDEVVIRPENPDGGSGNNDPSDQNDDTDNDSSNRDGNNPENGGQDDDGTKIKIVGDNPANGISLTNQANNTVTAVPANSIAINDPSKITFIVPATLPEGDYKLSLTTQFSSATQLLKEPRIYTFDYVLTV